jgi:hypothetical protein
MYFIYRSIFESQEVLEQMHLYWLEVVTSGLPPCVIIQGNKIQTVTASA